MRCRKIQQQLIPLEALVLIYKSLQQKAPVFKLGSKMPIIFQVPRSNGIILQKISITSMAMHLGLHTVA